MQQFFSLYTGEEELILEGTEDLEKEGIYVSASRTGERVFLKLVNTSEEEKTVDLCCPFIEEDAEVRRIALSGKAEDYNSLTEGEKIVPVTEEKKFSECRELKGMSVTVLLFG